MSSIPEKGSVWRHRKGNFYTVVGVAMDSDTGDDVVVYTGKDNQMWTRPLAEFMDGRFTEQERSASPRTIDMSTEDFLRQVVFR